MCFEGREQTRVWREGHPRLGVLSVAFLGGFLGRDSECDNHLEAGLLFTRAARHSGDFISQHREFLGERDHFCPWGGGVSAGGGPRILFFPFPLNIVSLESRI